MNRIKTGLAAILIALSLVSLVACKGKQTASASGYTVNPSASAVASADAAKLQAKVSACLTKTGVITKTQRQNFYVCAGVSQANEAKVEQCAQAKLAADGVLSKAARAKFYTDLAGCVVS